MKEITKQDRKDLATRISRMNYLFTSEYIEELRKIEEEKKAVEAAKNSDKQVVVVMTGEWNAQVDLDCMKACVEIIDYLMNDDECDLTYWQLSGINAMLDASNEEGEVNYSMPQAISDCLGIRFLKKSA